MLLPTTPGSAQSADVIVEIGPHGALAGPIRQILSTPELKSMSVSYETCLTRGEDAIKTMQTLVSSLVRKGCQSTPKPRQATGLGRSPQLPLEPFQWSLA